MHCVNRVMIWTWKTKILQWYDAQFIVAYNTKANLPSSVDWVMDSKDIQVLIPGPVNLTLYGWQKRPWKHYWVKDFEIFLDFLDELLMQSQWPHEDRRFDYREVSMTLKTDTMLLAFKMEEGTARNAVL